MTPKRLDNSGAILPLQDDQRHEFQGHGTVHLKNYFSESLVERLKSEWAAYLQMTHSQHAGTGSEFKFNGFARFLDSRNIFELDSSVSQIGDDLLKSHNVFLFDGPVAGRPSCSVWIPLEDGEGSDLPGMHHVGHFKTGDCIVMKNSAPSTKWARGIVLHVVGEEASAHSSAEVVA